MKKLTVILLFLMAGMTDVFAQNANRSGFFFEAGAGGFVGETPRVALERTKDNQLILHFADGVSANLFFGYRVRIANHWAYECRFGLESPVKCFNPLFSPKVLPIGFRYTSGEIFRNQSLYAYLDLGTTLVRKGNIYLPESPSVELVRGRDRGGIVGECGIGLSLTSHFYVGLCVSGTKMLGRFWRYHAIEHMGWGTYGVKIGYRI